MAPKKVTKKTPKFVEPELDAKDKKFSGPYHQVTGNYLYSRGRSGRALLGTFALLADAEKRKTALEVEGVQQVEIKAVTKSGW